MKARVIQASGRATIAAERGRPNRRPRKAILVPPALMVLLFALYCGQAQAAQTVTITASFSPDVAGAPTLAQGGATFTSTTGLVPSPLSRVSIIGPAGLGLDLKGSATCSAITLESRGPGACPARSVAGSGGGMGIFELGAQIIEEPFTVELFLANNKPGHYEVLLYVNAVTPVSVQLVLHGPIANQPKPYGLGFSFDVPEVKTLPGASNASVKSAHITLGATPAERKRFHVKGIIVPKTCPKGGFPVKTEFGFEDGTTVIAKNTIACPTKTKHHSKHH
jgi:hypothetical protein